MSMNMIHNILSRKMIMSDRLKNVFRDDAEFEKRMLDDGKAGNSLLIK